MKFIRLSIYLFISAALMTSCKKEVSKSPLSETSDANTAKLKVIYASAYVIRDSIQIKINDVRVSHTFLGNSTTNLTTPFPGGGLNTGGDSRPFYLSVPPGSTKLFISVPKKNTSIDSIIRFNGQINLEAGKFYSAFITDTLLNASVVLVEDNMAPVPNKFSRFKFVNLIPNAPGIDLYFGSALVAPNVPYKSVSPEFTLPADSTTQWRIRPAGALPTSAATAIYPSGTTNTTIPNQRAMTVFAKGYIGGTAARTPILALLYTK